MYRVTITGAETTEKEQVLLRCTIEQSADGEQWAALPNAPDRLALSLSAGRGVLRAPGGETERRAALQELVRSTARALPALYGAAAIAAIEALLPEGWPVTVPL